MVLMVMMVLMAFQALYMFRRLQASLIVLLAIFSVRAQTKLLMLFYDAFVHVVCCQLCMCLCPRVVCFFSCSFIFSCAVAAACVVGVVGAVLAVDAFLVVDAVFDAAFQCCLLCWLLRLFCCFKAC